MPILRFRLISWSLWHFLAVPLAALLLAGCGKGTVKETAAADDPADEEAAEAEPAAGAAGKERKPAARKKKKSAGGQIGGIPKDAWPEVWFKDPLAIAAEKGSATGAVIAATKETDPQVAKGGTSEPPSEKEKPAAATNTEPKAGGSDWAALISGEALADESKTIKNSLTDKLANKGRYDSTYKELRVDAAVLACLAGIAPELPEAPNWKTNAKYVRDMAAQVSSESTANGEKFFIKARAAYDKLDELLAGSKPGGLEDSADNVKFSEVAKRNFLMLRMGRAYDWMKANVNTEPIFKKESAKVSHEAAVLALLAKIVSTPGYNDADDDDYRKFTEVVSKSGLEIETAVKDQDFKAFTAALDRCYKGCSDCHQNFKNN